MQDSSFLPMSFDPFGTFRRASARTAESRASSPPASGAGASVQKQRPTTAATAPWHQRTEWKRAGRQLFRWYSKRSDFRFVFKPGQREPLACVSSKQKRVEVTTAFPEPGAHTDFDLIGPAAKGNPSSAGANASSSIRHADMLRQRPTEVWLRGFTGHEAGHILFSGEKPSERALGWLWNALEDERMERLTAGRYGGYPGGRLARIFDLMGDVMLSETGEERSERLTAGREAKKRAASGDAPRPFDVMNACLQWRWLKGHAQRAADAGALSGAGYHPYLSLPEPIFERARPLVEEAWSAPASADVTDIAREILAMFDIPFDCEVPEGLDTFDLPGGAVPGDGPSDGTGDEDPGDEDDSPPTGGSRPEGTDENPPRMPAIDPLGALSEDAADLLGGQRAGTKALAEALRPEQPVPVRTPHRSRGRFEYRRYARGQGRVFSQRPDRPQPPAFVTVLLDMSGSMRNPTSEEDGTPLLGQAKRCVALLSGAAEMAGTHLRVIPFTTEAGPPLSSRDAGHEMLRLAIASARPQGRTKLAPALRAAFSGADAGRGLHVVALISDGELEERDAEACQRLYQRARRGSASASDTPLVLPLLLGAAASSGGSSASGGPTPEEVYDAIFRRHAPIEDASDLPSVAARWLKHAT